MWNGGWGWWGPGLIFMVFCMVVMWRMMSHGHGSHRSDTASSGGHGPDPAERILAERLARGEIDVEEYERRLAALHQTSELDRT
jgi:putative membrane protein